MYGSALIVLLFLTVNGVVIYSGLVYFSEHPELASTWMNIVRYGGRDVPLDQLLLDLSIAVLRYPQLLLGLGGLELSLASAPLVRGRPGDDPARPRGRIRSMRLVLTAAAVIMSVFLIGSVFVTTMLVPRGFLHAPRPSRWKCRRMSRVKDRPTCPSMKAAISIRSPRRSRRR